MSVAARQAVAPVRTPPPHRYVYVIGPAAGLQKVGLATDPKARLAALQTACPFDLVLHVAVRVPFGEAHAVERRAHRALADRRGSGEWFNTTVAEAVAAVRDATLMRSAVLPIEVALLPLFAYASPGASSPPIFSRSRLGRIAGQFARMLRR